MFRSHRMFNPCLHPPLQMSIDSRDENGVKAEEAQIIVRVEHVD